MLIGRYEMRHVIEQVPQAPLHVGRVDASLIVLRQARLIDSEIPELEIGHPPRHCHSAAEPCAQATLVGAVQHVVNAGREYFRRRSDREGRSRVENQLVAERIDQGIPTGKEQLPA